MANVTSYETTRGKRFRVRFRKPDGTQTDKRGFTRKRDAEAWAAEHVTVAKASGTYIDVRDGNRRVSELWEAWIGKKRVSVKPSYEDDLVGAWRKYVAPHWANVPVSRVTRRGVQRWVAEISDGTACGGVAKSPSVVLRAHGVLAGILDDAVADRLIPSNPARGVELPRKPRRTEHTYLDAAQLYALAGECGRYRPLILTLGLTGLRWGEAIGLRVGDVDMRRHRINVSRSATQVGRSIVLGTPKTSELRSVVFPDALEGELPIKGREPEEILFFNENTEDGYMRQVESPKARGNWFSNACDRAGIPRMTVHDLRHTAASLMVRSGANVKAVQRQLGHSSAAMTLDVYADLFDDDLDALGEAMGELLLKNVGKMWAKHGRLVA